MFLSVKTTDKAWFNLLSDLIEYGNIVYEKLSNGFKWLFMDHYLNIQVPIFSVLSSRIEWLSIPTQLVFNPSLMLFTIFGGTLFAIQIYRLIKD